MPPGSNAFADMSANIGEMILRVTRKTKFGTLEQALRKAGDHELWELYHEALCHEQTEACGAMKKLAAAVAGKVAAEAIRRCGPGQFTTPHKT
jgi:hypothetical protein